MFCPNCGSAVNGEFCQQCGTRMTQAAHAAAPPIAPVAPAKSSNTLMKILIGVAVVCLLFVVLIAAAGYYVAHRVKTAALRTAHEYGVDLPAVASTGVGHRYDACSLLSASELSGMLNLQIDRSESSGTGYESSCRYYSSASSERGANDAAEALRKMKDLGSSGTSAEQQTRAMDQVSKLAKGLGASSSTNGPVLTVNVDSKDAGSHMAATKIAMGVFGAIGANGKARNDTPTIGDETAMAPLAAMLVFRKGNVCVEIDGRLLPGGRDSEITIARHIADKI